MKKPSADALAIKLTSKILSTNPTSIIYSSNYGENTTKAAKAVADFIRVLSNRLQSDIDESVFDDILDKS
ncbi:hypothetical protein RHO12_01080 [Orbus sturtevantii]|uniref:hypothetical protein n=1 Tax=Orbus sturtevantii TaxID=3074109 RepID=UPI00370DB32E